MTIFRKSGLLNDKLHSLSGHRKFALRNYQGSIANLKPRYP